MQANSNLTGSGPSAALGRAQIDPKQLLRTFFAVTRCESLAQVMSSTPRAKPTAKPDGPAPAAKPATGEKKAKAKKPKGAAPTAPIGLGMPMNKPADMSEEAAKADLESLQKKYGALVVNFNNQQAELASSQKRIVDLESENERLRGAANGNSSDAAKATEEKLAQTLQELRALEATNMALQKKVNKLQVEHVSEEEVDQLFYALEQKEQQLEQAMADKANLEEEVLTARQLSARGGAPVDPKFIEIHHHNDISDDDDSDDDEKKSKSVPVS